MNGNSLAEEESGVLDQGLESVRTAPAAPSRLLKKGFYGRETTW